MASVSENLRFRSNWSPLKGRRKAVSRERQAAEQSQADGSHPGRLPEDIGLMLEQMVIPRLLVGHAEHRAPASTVAMEPAARAHPLFSAADVDAMTELALDEKAGGLLDFVNGILRAGHSVETVFVELLAPTARRLGDYWDSDREDFVAVTMALWRIQEVLRELAARVPAQTFQSGSARRALFSPMPGDQHSFGTLMVAECFERAGWQAEALIEPDRAELVGKFSSEAYDLVGLTVSNDCSSATLAALVTTIRTVSRNPKVKILIGGACINKQPGLAEACGADGTAPDAMSAVTLADNLVPAVYAATFLSP